MLSHWGKEAIVAGNPGKKFPELSEDDILVRPTLDTRLVGDQTYGRPALEVPVLGQQSSSRVTPARSSTRHSTRTNVILRNDTVLDLDQSKVDITHSLLTGFVRDNRGIHLHQSVGDVALIQSQAPPSQTSLVPVNVVFMH